MPSNKRKTRSQSLGGPSAEDPPTPATAPFGPVSNEVPLQPLLPPPALDTRETASSSSLELKQSSSEELSQLECPVCFSYMQPPFMKCANAHPVCGECKMAGELTVCPMCRTSIKEDGALSVDSRLELLASRAVLPCTNGCGAHLPYLVLRGVRAKPVVCRLIRPHTGACVRHAVGRARARGMRSCSARLPAPCALRLRPPRLVHQRRVRLPRNRRVRRQCPRRPSRRHGARLREART